MSTGEESSTKTAICLCGGCVKKLDKKRDREMAAKKAAFTAWLKEEVAAMVRRQAAGFTPTAEQIIDTQPDVD